MESWNQEQSGRSSGLLAPGGRGIRGHVDRLASLIEMVSKEAASSIKNRVYSLHCRDGLTFCLFQSLYNLWMPSLRKIIQNYENKIKCRLWKRPVQMRSSSFISLMENPPLPPCQGGHLTNTCQLVACGQNKPFPCVTSPEDGSGLSLHPDPQSHPLTWAVDPPLPLLWAHCSFSRPASYLFLLSMHLHVIYITLIVTFIHGTPSLSQRSWILGT